jgi:hypothetical protein
LISSSYSSTDTQTDSSFLKENVPRVGPVGTVPENDFSWNGVYRTSLFRLQRFHSMVSAPTPTTNPQGVLEKEKLLFTGAAATPPGAAI